MRILRDLFLGALLVLFPFAASAYDLAKAPQACTVVSKEDAQKIAKESIGEVRAEKPTQSEKVIVTQCAYASTDGMKSMNLLVRISNAEDNSPDYVKQTMKDSGMPIEDVSGVGDTAFWTMMQFQAFKGKGLQVVVSVFGFSEPKEKAMGMAKLALENLEKAGVK